MKNRTVVLAATGVVLGAGAASGDIVTFNFPINVEQEVPVPDVEGFSPSGTGFVVLDTDTNEINWEIEYQGLTGDIVAPGAHFHGPADFGETAGIQIFLSDGDPPEPPTGTLTGSATLTDQQESDLLAGLWYVNIHTARNQPGEIRGQVIPAPASLALLGLGGLAATRRRR